MNDLGEDFVPKLAVVGAGGQGCNLVNRLFTSGLKSATTIALNTDAKHLNIVQAHKKLLIGRRSNKGTWRRRLPGNRRKGCGDEQGGDKEAQ